MDRLSLGAVWQVQCSKAELTCWKCRVKETLSVLLSVLSLRPLCFVFPSWVFREPSKRRRDLLA